MYWGLARVNGSLATDIVIYNVHGYLTRHINSEHFQRV